MLQKVSSSLMCRWEASAADTIDGLPDGGDYSSTKCRRVMMIFSAKFSRAAN